MSTKKFKIKPAFSGKSYNVKVIEAYNSGSGYICRTELIDDGVNGETKLKNCYSTFSGTYIGTEENAKHLCDEMNLKKLQCRVGEKNLNICQIGFNEKEQKWYGWSHRAICGFGIGSKIKKGDTGYLAPNKEEFLKYLVSFWKDENKLNVNGKFGIRKDDSCDKNEIKENPLGNDEKETKCDSSNDSLEEDEGVIVSWVVSDNVANKKIRGKKMSIFHKFPEVYGRGEWEAKTLEDAKQMASDFAKNVS